VKYLLYCIFHSPACAAFGTAGSPEHRKLEFVLGVGGEPVLLIAKDELNAVISRIAPSQLSPDIPRILAYEKVIESFHQNHTVIPMRYGCLFDEESQIIRLLDERYNQYQALLEELKGCMEMGISILSRWETPNTESPPGTDSSFCRSVKASLAFAEKAQHPGRAFLDARKAFYAQEERIAKEHSMLTEQCRAAFSGLFIKCKAELKYLDISHPPSPIPLHSLYFLVPRGSVTPFHEAFQEISQKGPAKLLLSGPWPPYNFVLPDQNPNPHGL
jgi:hypothetical protein